jgi:hypothetical protein
MQDANTIAEFFYLWHEVQEIQSTEQRDAITWKWTEESGRYTAKFAYLTQCQGAYGQFDTKEMAC